MSSRILIAVSSDERCKRLQSALRRRTLDVAVDIGARQLEIESFNAAATQEECRSAKRFDMVLVSPNTVAVELADPLARAGQEIAECFSTIKAAVRHFEQQGGSGSIVVLVPAEAAMGATPSTADAAVAGALLSLVRTVAIEMRGSGISANTLLYSLDNDDPETGMSPGSLDAITELLGTLMKPTASSITGQEIFVTGGADVGRLRP